MQSFLAFAYDVTGKEAFILGSCQIGICRGDQRLGYHQRKLSLGELFQGDVEPNIEPPSVDSSEQDLLAAQKSPGRWQKRLFVGNGVGDFLRIIFPYSGI